MKSRFLLSFVRSLSSNRRTASSVEWDSGILKERITRYTVPRTAVSQTVPREAPRTSGVGTRCSWALARDLLNVDKGISSDSPKTVAGLKRTVPQPWLAPDALDSAVVATASSTAGWWTTLVDRTTSVARTRLQVIKDQGTENLLLSNEPVTFVWHGRKYSDSMLEPIKSDTY